ncbi:MAG: phosphoglycerate kinase [Myxococcales bacterium]|nr:phosphoglycerate kinase [Myxococcales bacterium]
MPGVTLESLNIRSVRELELNNRKVLLRCDFNTPLDDDGEVADDSRIAAVLPTIAFIQEQGGRVICCSHLGRPKGTRAPQFSLEPVARRLAELTGQDVLLPDDCIGDAAEHLIATQRSNQIVLLENLRFKAGEKANSEDLARKLSDLCDVYVNDAFGALHREHASVSALPKMMMDRAAGLLIERELAFLGELASGAPSPYIAIVGGAKITGKIEVLETLLDAVQGLIIGGAMANTFLAAQGHDMGGSLVEKDRIPLARHLLKRFADKGVPVWLPVDMICVTDISSDADRQVRPVGDLRPNQKAVDIGPETIELFNSILDGSAEDGPGSPRTVFWNGPMGVFEIDAFAKGTLSVARALARSSATSIIGGGDSGAAAKKAGVSSMITHVSTGGGASLEFLGGSVLPGLTALRGGRR